jgi:hypothetical protein
MEHAWCHDIARDAAVRAAEDGRTGPLPTLAEAIAAPFACTACGGFGMDHRCKESCDQCDGSGRAMIPKSGSASSAVDHENKGDGMRTERVTLEVTSAHDERLADCIVESIGDCLLHGESVRVVEEPLSDAWAQRLNGLTAERDAAIRERDAYQGEYYKLRAARITQSLTADRFASAVREADSLRARVDELEARTSTAGEGSCAAQAASGGGEGEAVALSISPAERDGLQVIVDGVIRHGNGFVVIPGSDSLRAVKSVLARHTTAPPQPRGWLTGEEREAVTCAAEQAPESDFVTNEEGKRLHAVLTALLARSSPPEVVLPVADCSWCSDYATVWRECLEAVRSSLAKAGVAVKETI